MDAAAPGCTIGVPVNPRTGIVRRVVPFRGEAGDAPIPIVGAELGALDQLGAGTSLQVAAGGAGWTRQEAQGAAVGEACERYCATFVDPGRIRFAAAADLPDAARGWAGFSEAQLRHPLMHGKPWDETSRLGWVHAEALGDWPAAWVPAQFVWVPYAPAPGEHLLGPALTTGFGAGWTQAEARVAGLYEVVERDAFTLAWLQRAVPPEVHPGDWPERASGLLRHARLRVFDLTHDVGLPTYLCTLEKPSAAGTVVCVGAATRHDGPRALEKAVLEAFQTFPYVRRIVRAEPGWRAEPGFANLTDFRQHCRFYTVHPEHRVGIAHLLDGPAPRAPPPRDILPGAAAPERLADAARRVAACGLRSYAVDITTRDVTDAGLHVARVLVPGAQPLHGIHQAAYLAGPRLVAAHRHLPYLDRKREVTPWPHPFA